MKHILTTGKGKNKRQWELSNEDFERFEAMFEENELIDMSGFDVTKMTLVEVPSPGRM